MRVALLRNNSLEPAWEIWSLYTLSGPARWSRQQSSCLRLFSKTCTWTGRWLTQANLQTPQQKVQHERGGMHWSIINLCHMVIKLEKQVPTEKKCNLFGRVLYTNMQVEWLSNTINRLSQLPRQVRPGTIEHKLFKHQCLKFAKIRCWASQTKQVQIHETWAQERSRLL